MDVSETFSWLRDSTAKFGLDGCQIEVLREPQEFYESLLNGIKNAERRVVLASLYLGTGQLEAGLVEALLDKCHSKESSDAEFNVKVLLDFTRGSRGDVNSRILLLPLLEKYGNSSQVALYHAPDLRGLLKQFMPDRYNETIGVSHLKVYLFDNTVIMSGANLSNDYFTNRQDRYIVIKDCAELANFLDDLVNRVSEFSFHLMPDNTVSMPQSFPHHPYEDRDGGALFKARAGEKISTFIKEYTERHNSEVNSESGEIAKGTRSKIADTWIYPLVQMGPLGVVQDEKITKQLFRTSAVGSKIHLASGYFNLTEDYQDTILQSRADYDVLMAAPEAMGFFGASGAAGAIPQAYTQLARRFYDKITKADSHSRILLSEYLRDKWTFHVKGLWYYLPNSTVPSLTLVGSPNLGYRSVQRDLECQVAIVTKNRYLQEKLHQEQLHINECSTHISRKTLNSRHVQTWVKFVSRFFKSFF